MDKSKKTSDEKIFNFVVNRIKKEEDIINSYEYLLKKLKNSKYEYFVEKNDLDKAFKISKELNILPIVSDINPNLLSSEWSNENEYRTFGFLLSSFSLYERDIFLGGPVDKNLVSGFSKHKMSNSLLLNEMVVY